MCAGQYSQQCVPSMPEGNDDIVMNSPSENMVATLKDVKRLVGVPQT